MKATKAFIGAVMVFIFSSTLSRSGIPAWYEDATIVDRAELIVVGHLKENSIQYVPHPNTPADNEMFAELARSSGNTNATPHAMSWEYHAILVISEIIKGQSSTNNIPLIIHYGLEPIVDNRYTVTTILPICWLDSI